MTWEWSKTIGKKVAAIYSLPLYMRCAIEKYAKKNNMSSRSAAAEKIIETGLRVLEEKE